ncbi:MAG: hypothetical protein Q4B21_07615, partial [Bacteroidia bacterium]|nr:hypothetical protein [Bacteroidia bacterium]
NENYRTNIISIIRYFNAEKRDDACNQLLGHLEMKFSDNNINSGAKLADSIQEMIDVIVLFSFLIQRLDKTKFNIADKDNTIIRIEALIDLIDKKVTEFEQMSEGSCI